MEDYAVVVKDVTKKFKVFYDKGQTFKERLLFRNRNHYEDRWVLKGISFNVKKGEAIGLIGENGCGKSTLLKLMSKIIYPDSGSIRLTGRVSSLIELGAGFHPDMSGRENIYTNASIFGLTKKEIDERIEKIIDFSELREFIDNPVRTYSSGMYMRLAFAVAINVDADILLIDEILAVGDAAFQAKCFDKLREIKASGTTIVIVSHSLNQIEQICERSYWIESGYIYKSGKPREVHPEYMEYMGKKHRNSVSNEEKAIENTNDNNYQKDELPQEDKSNKINNKRWGSKDICINSVKIFDSTGTENYILKTGNSFDIKINYTNNSNLEKCEVGIGIFRNDEVHCYGTNTFIDKVKLKYYKTGNLICYIEKNNLLPGEYLLDVALHADDGFAYDYIKDVLRFRVYSDIDDVGVARLDHHWDSKNQEAI